MILFFFFYLLGLHNLMIEYLITSCVVKVIQVRNK